MKKIRRKLSQNEVAIIRLNGVLNGITQYLKEKGLFEDCQSWFKSHLQGGVLSGEGKQEGTEERG